MLAGNVCKRNVLAAVESDVKIVNVDENLNDPQLCATIACDIYKHLRATEVQTYFFIEGCSILVGFVLLTNAKDLFSMKVCINYFYIIVHSFVVHLILAKEKASY